MSRINRRTFLGGTAAGATLLAIRPSTTAPPTPGADATEVPATDPRVARIIDLSRDRAGGVHVQRVGFVTADGTAGTLPIAAAEADELRAVLASRDFTAWQQRGLRVDGHKFVFIRDSEDGRVVHAIRRGEFVTIRVTGDGLVLATSGDGMAHNRAVEAVYQYTRRTESVA
ncbi:MAG: twin-arginine translocation signal domain-containing protein [Kofleriaceae bacterium]|nr:twin-arginine translocation signal domain-containing protein [Kofleriaceae bacterium]MCB9570738.1 twin-arginine translocation signal domain-containing protein [Kofleriaceae bacterium]